MDKNKTNVMRVLESKKIAYQPHFYESDVAIDGKQVAIAIGKDFKQVYKTLVIRSGKQYYVAVINVCKEVDLKRLAKILGVKALEMVKVRELYQIAGYERGACSPVGMKKLFPTYFDQEIETIEQVIVSGGKIGVQVELNKDELIQLVNGKVEDICHDQDSQCTNG